MELTNAAAPLVEAFLEDGDERDGWAIQECFETMALLLTPFAPHFSEEIREQLGCEGFASDAAWPVPLEALLEEDEVTIVVQVNGKLRARLTLPKGIGQDDVLAHAREEEQVIRHLEGKEIRKAIFVPDKLLNLVVQ